MTDKKTNEIDFKLSMGADERDNRFAQVRSKMLDKIGMFPRADMESETPENEFEPQKLISGNGTWAIGEDDTHDIAFYSISAGSSFNSEYKGGHSTDDLGDAVFYNDGTDEMIYGISTSGDVFTFNTNTNAYTSNIHSLSGAGTQHACYHPLDDRVYFITDKKIYRQNGTSWEGEVFDLPNNLTYKYMFAYKGFLAIVGEADYNDEVRLLLWNRDASTTELEKNVLVGYGKHLGMEVINETIVAIVSEAQRDNNKELQGYISIKGYNGSFFTEINRIIATYSQISVYNSTHNIYTDGVYMYIGLADGVKSAGIYRISSTGNVDIISSTSDVLSNDGNFTSLIKVYGILVVGYRDINGVYKLAQQYDSNNDYRDFDIESVYVTSFIGDPTVEKKLIKFTLSFTMTDADLFGHEEANVYYRLIDPSDIDDNTDEDNSWTKIYTYSIITDGEGDRKVQRHTSYQTLPEFKEIQFKITTKRGLNITKATYKYEYLKDE